MIDVKVKPCSRVGALLVMSDGSWLASVKSSPENGKANQELIALIAKEFGVHKKDVVIKSGAVSRYKRICIDNV